MAITVTRAKTDMIGTGPTGPVTIAPGPASYTSGVTGGSDLNLDAGGVVEADIVVAVIIAGAPTTSPTLQFLISLDGTNFVQDGGTIAPGNTASTTYTYVYRVPESAKKARVVITNTAASGNSITAWAQGNTLAVS